MAEPALPGEPAARPTKLSGPTGGAPLAPVARPGLPDRVVSQLLDALAGGAYPVGSRLPPEGVLAASAQVSRLTLREAVKVLRDKGVLRVEQGRGTFVNPPSAWSALDPALLASRAAVGGGSAGTAEQITETRRIVEVGAAGLAAQRRAADHLAALRASIAAMRSAHDSGDVPAFSEADVAFHDAVMAAAGNPFLAAVLQPVRALVQQVRQQTSLEPEMRLAAVAAHTRVLEAIAAGDERAARRAMSEHLSQAARAIERLAEAGMLVSPRGPDPQSAPSRAEKGATS